MSDASKRLEQRNVSILPSAIFYRVKFHAATYTAQVRRAREISFVAGTAVANHIILTLFDPNDTGWTLDLLPESRGRATVGSTRYSEARAKRPFVTVAA